MTQTNSARLQTRDGKQLGLLGVTVTGDLRALGKGSCKRIKCLRTAPWWSTRFRVHHPV